MRRPATVTITFSILVCAVCLAACGSSVESRTNDFSVGSSPALQVKVGNGNITVAVGQGGAIVVTAELRRPERVQYEVSQTGDLVIVEAKTESGSRADVTVTVPADSRFDLSSGNGNVDVTGVQASGVVAVGNGDATLTAVAGSPEVNIGNGDVTLANMTGSSVVNVGNGDIVTSETKGSVRLNTGNGAIRFHGELDPGTESFAGAGNGSVWVELSGSPSVAFDLEVGQTGKIRIDLPVSADEQSDRRFVGTAGDGKASLEVRAGNGDISIK